LEVHPVSNINEGTVPVLFFGAKFDWPAFAGCKQHPLKGNIILTTPGKAFGRAAIASVQKKN
jgi:hypothetical protein